MIERAVTFGRDGGLVGVLAEPAPERALPNAPALLMWNVGIQHRVGPYRIQVDIARDLALRGLASLRFDISGMGDSEVRQDNLLDRERAMTDAREAMALLERRRGARTFVPMGFCSSVDSVHALALEDPRVVGVCFLEGYAYHTRGFWLRYPLRLLSKERWKRYVTHLASTRFAVLRRSEIHVDPLREERAAMGSVFARQYPSRQQFGLDIGRLAARGARMLFVYVGGDTEFNYRGQFAEMVGGRHAPRGVEVEYYGGADHTFFRVNDRARVIARVGDWVQSNFGGTPVRRAAPERRVDG